MRREILERRRHLAEEAQVRSPGEPHLKTDRAHLSRHGDLGQISELLLQVGRFGHDVDGAEQARGDRVELSDIPLGADAAAVALEPTAARGDGSVQLLLRLALVASIGQQDGMGDGVRVLRQEVAREHQPAPHRRAALRPQPLHGARGVTAGLRRGRRKGPSGWVDDVRVVVTPHDREPHAIRKGIHCGGSRPTDGPQLRPGAAHRARAVEEDDLRSSDVG